MFETFDVKITGMSPLLMHNGQLADPLNPFTKQLKNVTSKRKKTDEDHAEIARIEWHGSLYTDEDGYPCIPGESLEACLIAGAKKSKLGRAFQSSVFVDSSPRLDYGGRRKAAELWNDPQFRDVRGVRVTTSRTMRCRPIFRKWELRFSINYDADQVNKSDVVKALADAGQQCGLGDYRPKFGRFEVELV